MRLNVVKNAVFQYCLLKLRLNNPYRLTLIANVLIEYMLLHPYIMLKNLVRLTTLVFKAFKFSLFKLKVKAFIFNHKCPTMLLCK